jgi:hypothetical protein
MVYDVLLLGNHIGWFGSLWLYHLQKIIYCWSLLFIKISHKYHVLRYYNIAGLSLTKLITMNAFNCQLSQQNFPSKNKLLKHEWNKHRNNKIIFHRTLLSIPSLEPL